MSRNTGKVEHQQHWHPYRAFGDKKKWHWERNKLLFTSSVPVENYFLTSVASLKSGQTHIWVSLCANTIHWRNCSRQDMRASSLLHIYTKHWQPTRSTNTNHSNYNNVVSNIQVFCWDRYQRPQSNSQEDIISKCGNNGMMEQNKVYEQPKKYWHGDKQDTNVLHLCHSLCSIYYSFLYGTLQMFFSLPYVFLSKGLHMNLPGKVQYSNWYWLSRGGLN